MLNKPLSYDNDNKYEGAVPKIWMYKKKNKRPPYILYIFISTLLYCLFFYNKLSSNFFRIFFLTVTAFSSSDSQYNRNYYILYTLKGTKICVTS